MWPTDIDRASYSSRATTAEHHAFTERYIVHCMHNCAAFLIDCINDSWHKLSSVCRLSVCNTRIAAKWYFLLQNCLNKSIGLPGG